MFEFFSSALPIARKEHTCEYCKKTIQVGEQYSVESGKYDGDFFTRKLCICCKNILDEYCSEVEPEFTWDDIDEWLADKHCSKCSKGSVYDSCTWDVSLCPMIRQKYMKGVV